MSISAMLSIALILFVIIIVAVSIKRRLQREAYQKMIRKKREAYEKALSGNDPELAHKLGYEYFTIAGNGKISDVNKKRLEYAIDLMQRKN